MAHRLGLDDGWLMFPYFRGHQAEVFKCRRVSTKDFKRYPAGAAQYLYNVERCARAASPFWWRESWTPSPWPPLATRP